MIRQSMRLDCESAALAVALEAKGIPLTQAWVFGSSRTTAASRGVRTATCDWGDPYAAFVGNVDGSETNYTGYGVYYPPIAAVGPARRCDCPGADRLDHGQIECQIRLGIPWSSGPTSTSHSRAPAPGAPGMVGSSLHNRGAHGHGRRLQLRGRDDHRHRCRGRPAQDHPDGGVHRQRSRPSGAWASPSGRSAATVDCRRPPMYVEDHPGREPATVWLHHGVGSTRSWDRFLPAMRPAVAGSIVYDRRGFGRSTALSRAHHRDVR